MVKAKVKATGEIVNVCFRSPLWVNGDTKETYFPKELETVWVEKRENPSKNIDYWTKLEHQYAGMAMQAYIIASHISQFRFCEGYMKDCKSIAHALVQKLKEKEERK